MVVKAKPSPKAASAPKPEEEIVEGATFTTLKKRYGTQWKATAFKYQDGRRVGIDKAGVHIELIRGQEFKPKAFCKAFRGEGWKPGEMLQYVEELIEFLSQKAEDRALKEVLYWEDRPRPMAQIVLEGENADLREQLAQMEEVFAAAVEKNPELAALREKVMAGA